MLVKIILNHQTKPIVINYEAQAKTKREIQSPNERLLNDKVI